MRINMCNKFPIKHYLLVVKTFPKYNIDLMASRIQSVLYSFGFSYKLEIHLVLEFMATTVGSKPVCWTFNKVMLNKKVHI